MILRIWSIIFIIYLLFKYSFTILSLHSVPQNQFNGKSLLKKLINHWKMCSLLYICKHGICFALPLNSGPGRCYSVWLQRDLLGPIMNLKHCRIHLNLNYIYFNSGCGKLHALLRNLLLSQLYIYPEAGAGKLHITLLIFYLSQRVFLWYSLFHELCSYKKVLHLWKLYNFYTKFAQFFIVFTSEKYS